MSKKFYAAVAIMVATCAQVSLAAWDGSAKVPKVVEKDGQNFYEITSPEELIGFLDSVLVGKAGDESLKAYLKMMSYSGRILQNFAKNAGSVIKSSRCLRVNLMDVDILFTA